MAQLTLVEAINRDGKSIVGAKVLILGLSYKPDVDDDRAAVVKPADDDGGYLCVIMPMALM